MEEQIASKHHHTFVVRPEECNVIHCTLVLVIFSSTACGLPSLRPGHGHAFMAQVGKLD